jgi:hypothetical protein
MHKLIPILLLFLFIQGCQSKEEKEEAKKQAAYVDFEKFKKGRPCGEVKFMCLPESQDKSWQSVPTKDHIEDLELTPKVEKRFKKIVKEWNDRYDAYHSKPHPKGEKKPMLITSLDKDFFDKVEARRFLEEMEESLEKEFPGFWRGVPIKVRYRWIQRAMNKAKKFGVESKTPGAMVELCARIGLDFDQDPKWQTITEFISKNEDNIGTANDYLDFTVFESDYSLQNGDKLTDWYLREAIGELPYPKRPIPKLNN